jgi:hypothetical protein
MVITTFAKFVQLSVEHSSHAVPPDGSDDGLLREYSERLIRKLEQKTVELEQANRALERDIAARVLAERRSKEPKRSCAKRRRWKRWGGSQAAWPTTSTTCSRSSSAMRRSLSRRWRRTARKDPTWTPSAKRRTAR